MGVCEGNCDSDTDCEEFLICEERIGDEEVEGCDGLGRSGTNYCRQPSLETLGNNGSPAEVFPLGLCAGDCDIDEECQVLFHH